MAVTDPSGGTTRLERDALGRIVRTVDPMGSVTRVVLDEDGNLARRIAPDGSTESWTHDGEGNPLSHTGPADGMSRFDYTHFDLLTARIGPDGTRHTFEHDADLRLTRVTGPHGTWSYTYDAAGRLASETDFDGRTRTYRYDAAGQLTARSDALGRTVSYTYDQLGQAVRKDVAGKVTTYAYDRAGRLLHAAGPDSEILYTYDRRGRTKTELVDGRAMNYAYDRLGRRARRVTPTGAVTEYGYDAAGRAARITSGGREIAFTHDAAGRELERVFGGSLSLASAWDEAGRISAQHLTIEGRSLNHRHYAHRADGHLTSVTDDLSGSRAFDLDPAGRVTAVHAEGWTERYAYDPAGNQTAASWPASHPGHDATGPRSYTGTSVTRAGNVRFEHDALGRVTLRQKTRLSRKPDTWRYEWDAEDRLSAVVTPDGTRWRYRYDPLGRRTAKQRLADDGESVAEEVRFTWDGTTLCEQIVQTPDLSHVVALTWDHRGLVPLSQTERLLTRTAVRRRSTAGSSPSPPTSWERPPSWSRSQARSPGARGAPSGAPPHGLAPARPITRCVSPASTTTRRPSFTTTFSATTTRRPVATPPRTPSASAPHRIRSPMCTTRSPSATPSACRRTRSSKVWAG